ncbi:MAG: glycoside hydrolase family 9 protein, partial [Chitinophagaceae bacterium]|nr:glycoside hydrolase family 9 protein [Chitinophagaceae bacterium]
SATVMGARISDFVWGSNAVAANQGMVLINAYLQTKERKYLDGALSNLDYLLGKNATGYSFVTGIGIKTPMHPHHRPSYADKIEEPVPGLLAGGPNANAYRQDKCSYKYREAERQYSDEMCSFASNEIAINWNAPLVYLSGAICAIDK